MKTNLTRRTWIHSVAGVSASTLLGASRMNVEVEIHEIKIISHQKYLYNGWPTLAKTKSGQLLVVCSGGRQNHICPFGRVEFMRSDNSGETWSWPRVLLDGPIDDRDAGILETPRGSLLATTFTSLAYASHLAGKGNDWKAAHKRIDADKRKAELGQWMIRSTDGGVSWSARYDCLVNSPHGPIALSDGRILYAGKVLYNRPKTKDNRPSSGTIGVCESLDDGQSWKWFATIEPREADDSAKYHELHAVEAANGKIIVHIRNHNPNNVGETLQCESSDGGKTWSKPAAIGTWGLPSHLLRLSDDRILMSYGHRRPPFGNQVRVSEDNGASWSKPIAISSDGKGKDLGYPSSVQLDSGELVTVWYEAMRGSPYAVLRQARWSLKS